MLNKEVKAVLFDMDGTLVNSFKVWLYVYNDSLKHFGFRILTQKEFRKCFGTPIEHAIKNHFINIKTKDLEKIYDFYFMKRMDKLKLFTDAISTLRKLKNQNIKLGLVTASTNKITFGILKEFKILRYFSTVITMNDVKRRKPAPDMVLKACRMLKVEPRNAILIGDTKNDMIAGKRAGCITVGYRIKGDYRINALKEIEKFIYV